MKEHDLITAMREVLDHVQGKITLESRKIEISRPEVREIRQQYALSQQDFARLFGISIRTLQKWEQGTRLPQGPAKVLLNVIGLRSPKPPFFRRS